MTEDEAALVEHPPNSYHWGMLEPVQPDAERLDGVAEIAGIQVMIRDGRVVLPKGVSVVHRAGRRSAASGRLGATDWTVSRPTPLRAVKASDAYQPKATAARVVEVLGNNVTAALLGVSNDRPSRWINGGDHPTEESRARLADLDSLIGQLLAAFTPQQATLWLEGVDPHLRARPLDVFRLEGSARVITAIRAYEQGAFA